MSFGRTCCASVRERAGTPRLKGRICCVQFADQDAIHASGAKVFHPAMNLSSVAAWILAGAGIFSSFCALVPVAYNPQTSSSLIQRTDSSDYGVLMSLLRLAWFNVYRGTDELC